MKQTPLKPGKALERRTPLNAIGRRGRRLAVGDATVRRKGYCELADIVPGVKCFGTLGVHHKQKRTYMDTRINPLNHITCCKAHHSYIHDNPNWSRDMGLIIDSKSRML